MASTHTFTDGARSTVQQSGIKSQHVFQDGRQSTPDYPASLTVARDNCAARLAEITVAPKPTYTVHGHSYSWTEYQAMLVTQIDNLNKLIAQSEIAEVVSEAI
jgi:hypothetical protein